MTQLVVQRRAMHDLDAARAHYSETAPHMLADWALAVDEALLHLQRQPGTGSPRMGLALGIAKLRTWPMRQFPYLICYTRQTDKVLVLRVLHQSSDLPTHLRGAGS